MRNLLFSLAAMLLVSCGNLSSDDAEKSADHAEQVEPLSPVQQQLQASAFMQYLAATDPSFSLEKFKEAGSFPLSKIESGLVVESIADYKPFLVYNSDSTQAVDLFSYGTVIRDGKMTGGEADTEAALLDFGQNKRRRLVYLGPSYGLVQANFFKGGISLAGYEQLSDTEVKPLFWMVDPVANTAVLYEHNGKVKAAPAEFLKQQYPGFY